MKNPIIGMLMCCAMLTLISACQTAKTTDSQIAGEVIWPADSNTVEVTTENRVQNGSFESGDTKPDMWEVSNASFTRSSEDAVDGKYSLQFSPKGRRSSVTQSVSLDPRQDYILSVWFKLSEGATGRVIFDTHDQFDDTCQFSIDAADAGAWKKYSGLFYNGSQTSVSLRCFASRGFSGTCYIDDIRLVVAEPPATDTESAADTTADLVVKNEMPAGTDLLPSEIFKDPHRDVFMMIGGKSWPSTSDWTSARFKMPKGGSTNHS